MGTERQTNVIINNIGYAHFACSEAVSWPVLQKFKQVCVSKLLSAKKEKQWEPCISFFMCLIDMNKFFEKHQLPLKNV